MDKVPKSQQQIITYALNSFKQIGELTARYNLEPVDTTWHNFKKHFSNTYNNILKIKGKAFKNIPYLQTNKTISQLTEEFVQMHSEVLNGVNALKQVHNIFESQGLSQEPSLTSTNVSSIRQTQAINCTIQNDTNEVKELISNLQKQIYALQNNTKQFNSIQNNSNKVACQQITVQGQRKRFKTSKYCWSHGACAYSSENCRNKKDGHKDTATFANKMGGSVDFCHKSE